MSSKSSNINNQQIVINIDLKGLIGIFGTFECATIENLFDALTILTDRDIIKTIYTMEDILIEIEISRYYTIDERTKIVTNCNSREGIQYTFDAYLNKLIKLNSMFIH